MPFIPNVYPTLNLFMNLDLFIDHVKEHIRNVRTNESWTNSSERTLNRLRFYGIIEVILLFNEEGFKYVFKYSAFKERVKNTHINGIYRDIYDPVFDVIIKHSIALSRHAVLQFLYSQRTGQIAAHYRKLSSV